LSQLTLDAHLPVPHQWADRQQRDDQETTAQSELAARCLYTTLPQEDLFEPDYIDLHDNRLQIFGTLPRMPYQAPRSVHHFYYIVRAVTPGIFTAPRPCSKSCMTRTRCVIPRRCVSRSRRADGLRVALSSLASEATVGFRRCLAVSW
jgi:hypothetical protein